MVIRLTSLPLDWDRGSGEKNGKASHEASSIRWRSRAMLTERPAPVPGVAPDHGSAARSPALKTKPAAPRNWQPSAFLTRIRLFGGQSGDDPVVLEVEGTECRDLPERAGGDQRVQQAEAVREVESGK